MEALFAAAAARCATANVEGRPPPPPPAVTLRERENTTRLLLAPPAESVSVPTVVE